MPLLHLYDRRTIEGSLALPLDPLLHDLLAARVSHLREQGLLDMTELAVITAETTEADLLEALGWTPLVDQDGHRYGQPCFCSNLDYVTRVGCDYYEAILAIGNSGFAFQLLVSGSADPNLIALCRELAA